MNVSIIFHFFLQLTVIKSFMPCASKLNICISSSLCSLSLDIKHIDPSIIHSNICILSVELDLEQNQEQNETFDRNFSAIVLNIVSQLSNQIL